VKISKRQLRQVIREEYTRLKVRKLLSEGRYGFIKDYQESPIKAQAERHKFKDVTTEDHGSTNKLLKMAATSGKGELGPTAFLIATYFDHNAKLFKDNKIDEGKMDPLADLFRKLFNKCVKPHIKDILSGKSTEISTVAANKIHKDLTDAFESSQFNKILEHYVGEHQQTKRVDAIMRRLRKHHPRDGWYLSYSGVLGAFLAFGTTEK